MNGKNSQLFFLHNRFVPFITFFVPHIEFEVQIFKNVNINFIKFHKEKNEERN